MNIEATIIEYLSEALDVPVSADVPTKRPDAFVTVERLGGNLSDVALDHAGVAVQSWAGTRLGASELMEQVDTAMRDMDVLNVSKVYRNSISNFPDPDNSMGRYQGYYEIVFYKED